MTGQGVLLGLARGLNLTAVGGLTARLKLGLTVPLISFVEF